MFTAPTGSCLLALIIAGLSALASPASAATVYVKFYNGGSGYTGPFSAAGTVYDNTKSLATNCPSSGTCSDDNLATPQTYSGTSASASAGGAAGNKVWDDLSPNFAGLGVGTGSPSDSDQIAGTDVLTIAFTTSTKLTGIGTLFDSPHTPFGGSFATVGDVSAAASTIVFRVSVNGGAFTDFKFSDANAMTLDLEGKTFAFMQETGSPEFYLSALSYEVCGGDIQCGNLPGTPLPATLPLFATGLGAMGLLGWRKKRRSRAAT